MTSLRERKEEEAQGVGEGVRSLMGFTLLTILLAAGLRMAAAGFTGICLPHFVGELLLLLVSLWIIPLFFSLVAFFLM